MADNEPVVEKRGVKWLVVVPLLIVILLVGLGGYMFLNGGYDFSVDVVEESSIDVDQVLMKVMLKDSDTLVKELRVMNTGDLVEEVSVSSNMGDMVAFSEESFSIEPGQTKVLDVGFRSFVEQTSVEYSNGVYVGEILVGTESIPVVVEVESEEVLFDMNINFPTGNIEAGDDVNIDVRLYNLMDTSAMSINVEYFVKDLKGNVLFSESETVVVDTQVSFTKSVSLPDNFAYGTYVFGAEANYAGSTGTSSYLFDVDGEDEEELVGGFCPIGNPICMMIFLVFVLVFIFLIIVLLYFLKNSLVGLFDVDGVGVKDHVKNKSFVYTMLVVLITLLVVLLVYVMNSGSFDVFTSVPVQVYVALLVLVGVFVFVYIIYAFLKSFGSLARYFREKREFKEEKLKDLARVERRNQVALEKQKLFDEKEKVRLKAEKVEKRKVFFSKLFLPFTLVGKAWTGLFEWNRKRVERKRKLKEMRILEKEKLKHLKEVQKHELELLKAKKEADEKRRLARKEAYEKRKLAKKEADEKRRLAYQNKKIAKKEELERIVKEAPEKDKKSLFSWFSKEEREKRRFKRLEEKHQKEVLDLKKKELLLKEEQKKKEKILELERESLMLPNKGRSFFKNVKQNVKGYAAERKHKAKQKELKKKFAAKKIKVRISKEDKEISKLRKLLGKK